jgi:hypothetical protein
VFKGVGGVSHGFCFGLKLTPRNISMSHSIHILHVIIVICLAILADKRKAREKSKPAG